MTGYAFQHEGVAFSPDGRLPTMTAAEVKSHNTALEALELARWNEKPTQFAVYVTGTKVTTWLGTELGVVIARSRFRTNISRNIEAITVRGTNGAKYHGRYGADWSQLCRLTRYKNDGAPLLTVNDLAAIDHATQNERSTS